MRLRPACDFFLLLVVLCCSAVLTFSQTQLVPGTAVLLSQSSGNGGNGGNTSSTTSSTNIFSPSVFVDYKRFGGGAGIGRRVVADDLYHEFAVAVDYVDQIQY